MGYNDEIQEWMDAPMGKLKVETQTKGQVEAMVRLWRRTKDELPEEFTTVIISGGIGQLRNKIWYTGMEDPIFQRPIQWEVKFWMPIPKAPKA